MFLSFMKYSRSPLLLVIYPYIRSMNMTIHTIMSNIRSNRSVCMSKLQNADRIINKNLEQWELAVLDFWLDSADYDICSCLILLAWYKFLLFLVLLLYVTNHFSWIYNWFLIILCSFDVSEEYVSYVSHNSFYPLDWLIKKTKYLSTSY